MNFKEVKRLKEEQKQKIAEFAKENNLVAHEEEIYWTYLFVHKNFDSIEDYFKKLKKMMSIYSIEESLEEMSKFYL